MSWKHKLKNANQRVLGAYNWILKASPVIVFFVFSLYCVADILTSPQTYHENANRSLSQILLLSLTGLCLLFSVIFAIKNKRRINKRFLILALFWVSLPALPIVSDFLAKKVSSNTFTLAIYPFSFLTFFSFWFLVPEHYLPTTRMRVLFFAFVFLITAFLVFYFFKVRGTPLASLNYRKPIFAHVYLIVGLLPLAFYLFNFKSFIWILAYIALAIVLSDKGTPLLSVIAIAGYLVLAYTYQKKRKLFFGLIFGGLLLALAVLFLDTVFLHRALISRILDESMMIRLNGYVGILKSLETFSIKELLLGKGSSAVIALRGLAAHNDYLEYLYDFGLVGLILFSGFIVSFFFTINSTVGRKNGSLIFFVVIVSSLLLPITLASALFTNTNLPLFLSTGIVAGKRFSAEQPFEQRSIPYDYFFI